MPTALILLADGSEEIEFVTPYDVLVRAGFEVKSVGVQLKDAGYATCSRHIRIIPDHPSLQTILPHSAPSNFDILILPGGAPGAKTFCSSDAVLELIHNFRKAGKWVGAICAGTTALVESEKKFEGETGKGVVTSHPSVEHEIREAEWEYSDGRVVVDESKRLVTSRGPGTALTFALKIVELIVGKEKRNAVAGPMIVAPSVLETLNSS